MTTWKPVPLVFAAALLIFPVRDILAQRVPERLNVGEDGRRLVSHDGRSVFLIGDTAWGLAWDLSREGVREYLDVRREQAFNGVAVVASGWGDEPVRTATSLSRGVTADPTRCSVRSRRVPMQTTTMRTTTGITSTSASMKPLHEACTSCCCRRGVKPSQARGPARIPPESFSMRPLPTTLVNGSAPGTAIVRTSSG